MIKVLTAGATLALLGACATAQTADDAAPATAATPPALVELLESESPVQTGPATNTEATAHSQEQAAPAPVETIPLEIEYQFLKLASILSDTIDPEQLGDLAAFATSGPDSDFVNVRLLAEAIDLSADQTVLQSDPRVIVSAGLYLLSVGHRNDIAPRLQALVETDPTFTAYDLNLMEEAILIRWNILDALQSIRAMEAIDVDAPLDIDPVIGQFEEDTLQLRRDYNFAVFTDQVDRLSDEHLEELRYTLRTYVLGVSRDVDQETVTSSIRRVEDLNEAARQQANATMARTLRAIFGYGY